MAIFQKTEPGLLYELSPGRDGRLLVWSPGLMKYKDCTSLEEVANVNSNYLEQDIDDGCWFYQLPNLRNGDNMFYNADMTELYEGRVPLWHFESNLQSLQSGVNMFKGCALDAASIKRIADTLSSTAPGTITLGIHYALEGDSSVTASLAKIENKGWSVETEYNLPYGFTELEYLESSGTQYINTGVEMTDDSRIKASAATTATGNNNTLFGLQDLKINCILRVRQQTAAIFTAQIGYTADVSHSAYERYFDVNLGDMIDVEAVGIQKVTVNGVTKNGNYTKPWQTSVPLYIPIFVLAYTYGATVGYNALGSYKLYSFAIWQGEEKLRDYVPVLRNADGVAGLYDKVSRQCFYNKGTGKFGYRIKRTGDESAPFSLRDPYYVAPSGVYARPAGENELDIVADTDMTADIAEQNGYIWFTNTGEAYEHFGITQQSIEGEVIDA